MDSELAKIFKAKDTSCNVCKIYEYILNVIPEPIALVDNEGYVVFFNKQYQEFLNISDEEAIGKHVTEIIENTRLHVVISTEKPEIDYLQNIKGREAIVQRIPVFMDGKLLGAIGKISFRDVDEVKSLAKKLQVAENKAKKFENELRYTATYDFADILGVSQSITAVKRLAHKVAATNTNVLIQGETGVGKELFAHAIHNNSNSCNGPFVSINCAAIPQDLLESELFGYDEGAFTGARKNGKIGKFELADGGTIFLDEIGDMPLGMQSKLLRVLQDRQFERVGGLTRQKVDVRVIAATNVNIEDKVRNNEFRADLFYRLNTISLIIPPLRERYEDISLIVDKSLKNLNSSEYGNKRFSSQAMQTLTMYDWPGNIRELLNVVERLFFLVDSDLVEENHVKQALSGINSEERKSNTNALEDQIHLTEKDAIINALESCNGNKAQAAKLLGIHRTTLYQKMKKLNM
ncbi:sigma-54 interaction domain-containing protein [Dethiobacter alkaliphilus]|uniref:PAS modulated sigma54 specific transcriptional regulator, Fis family n=1 Tax=Dethiobacter alkaliphilus AHT 1 TaxID=555088 RepID=C0GEJ3_DETAL|nr:sigma 54-interacting transcriptional regulator [Dethiobacter alkaliphilus]EEG78487.1 PAS modulated sigma54 specific transcriptional regulator, Fis family [Dethiobacter alkaliphilus AHT 1]